jgi:protocatechuate 3,4-dioxygenase beta subunit
MAPARPGDGEKTSPDGATLIVHVVADREPLAGARLVLEGRLRATTDATGTAVVRGLAPGRYRGWLLAEGRADERIDLAVHEDPEAVHERFVTLPPGSCIEGRIVDEHGAPVADAWVRVIASDGQLCYEARSDMAGHWHVSARAGTYRAHGSTGGPWSALVDFACDGQRPCDVVVRLEPAHGPAAQAGAACANAPARIAGTVVDTANEPVANATVTVLKRGTDATSSFTFAQATATTDERGRFDIGGLAEGEHDVIAHAPAPLG